MNRHIKSFITLLFSLCLLQVLTLNAQVDSDVQNDTMVQADSWITMQFIGSAPGMDEYRGWDQDFGWNHTFDPTGKIIHDVELTIRAYDVDSLDNETDVVYADGNELGILVGDNETWSETSFMVDRSLLYDDGKLNVWVDIDSLQNGFNVTIDRSSMRTHWDWANPDGDATNITGGIKDLFLYNETVYAAGSGFPGSSLIDVYVVNDTQWSDNMAIPPPIIKKTVLTDGDGNLGLVEIWHSPTMPGEYDLVFDIDQDGVYKTIVSVPFPDVVDDPNHPGFTVVKLPVGGELLPKNMLASFSPWFALAFTLVAGYALKRKQYF